MRNEVPIADKALLTLEEAADRSCGLFQYRNEQAQRTHL